MPACPSFITSAAKIAHPPFFSPFPLICILPFLYLPLVLPPFLLTPSSSSLSAVPSSTSSPPLIVRRGSQCEGQIYKGCYLGLSPVSHPIPSLSHSLSLSLSFTLLSLPRSPSKIFKEPTCNPIQPCRTRQCSQAVTHFNTYKHTHALQHGAVVCEMCKTLVFAHRDTFSAQQQQQQQFTKTYNCIGHTLRNTHTQIHTSSFSAQSHAKRQKTN